MKQLQYQILSTFIVIFTLFSLSFSFFLHSVLSEDARNHQRTQLTEQAKLMADFLNELPMLDNEQKTESFLANLSKDSKTRLTLISTTGQVLYDSSMDKEQIENHLDREEVQDVLKGKPYSISERKSETTLELQFYVAVPVVSNTNEITAVLRLAQPEKELAKIGQQIPRVLFLFILLALGAASIVAYFLAKKIAKPVQEVMFVTKELANKNYAVRFSGRGYGELAELGSTVNELAVSLEDQMQEIKQNDKQLHELINHLVIGVMLLDHQRSVQMVNPAMERILRTGADALIGKPYVEVIKSYGLSHLIEKTYRKKTTQNDEIYFYYPEDTIVDANIVPLIEREPNDLRLIVLLYDITEIRRLEKVRTDFVANASHELRTPVTALKGFTETLLDGAMKDPEVLQQFLDIMLKESRRLDSLVNDILELSRAEQKQVPLEVETVSLEQTVNSAVQLVRQKADQKKITINMVIDPLMLQTDPDRLKQVLANLLHNAVAYTQEKGEVVVRAYQEDQMATIQVKDNGIGIPEDEQDRIFERFYRVDKARSRYSGGTGLGLSIVRYLVENLNGTIFVESKLGLGTVFTVKLPIRF